MASDYKVFRGTNLVGVFGVLELTDAVKDGRVLDSDLFVTDEMDRSLPIHALEIKKQKRPMRRLLSKGITGFLGFLWLGGIILLITGGPWVGQQLVPLVNLAATIVLLVGLPISLLLLIFRKTRAWGGVIIFLISLPWWVWLWLVSLVYAFSVSFLWSVVGIVLGGVGIVPVAGIMMLIHGDWPNLVALLGTSIVIIALRWIGLSIIGRMDCEASRRDGEANQQNIRDARAELESAISDYHEFLKRESALITKELPRS